MRIAIMQPYFFPYLGYFNLMHHVDLFIVYDMIQHNRRGWIHRNRILHQNGSGWQYMIVPVEKTPQKTPIREIKISSGSPWREKLLGQLAHYLKAAPYAEPTLAFLKESLMTDEVSLSRSNVHLLACCSRLLDIDFQYQFCSDLKIDLSTQQTAEEKILDICEFLGAKEYINLPGGVDLYHAEAFAQHNIKLTFLSLPSLIYSTEPYAFEPDLSIVDLLMWNRPEEIKSYLDHHRK